MASTDVAPASMSGANAAQANMAFIVAIVAVATIGGFMFGYDSGVINGTQDGLERAFGLSKLGVGFNVGAILLGFTGVSRAPAVVTSLPTTTIFPEAGCRNPVSASISSLWPFPSTPARPTISPS